MSPRLALSVSAGLLSGLAAALSAGIAAALGAPPMIAAGGLVGGVLVLFAAAVSGMSASMKQVSTAGASDPSPREEASPGSEFVAASARLDVLDQPPRAEAVAIELARYKDVVTILTRQIEGSTDVTETAAFDIVSRLQTINEAVERFIEFLDQAGQASAAEIESGARAVAANSDLVRQLRSLIETRTSDRRADREAYAQIANETDQFSDSLEAISRIAFQTHVIAINASIEAARLGPAGRGFTVVAGEVRDLANEAAQVAKDVAAGLSRLRAMTNQRMTQKSDNLDESILLDSVEKQSRTAEAGFRQLSESQRATLTEARSIGEQASQDVLSALAGVQFQDIVRQRLAGVKAGLDHMGDHATLLADALLDPAVDVPPVSTTLIRQMEVEYVMESQFEAHKGPDGRDIRPAEPPVIEMF